MQVVFSEVEDSVVLHVPTVVIPRVAVEQRKGTARTNSSAGGTSGPSGTGIAVQVDADKASAL